MTEDPLSSLAGIADPVQRRAMFMAIFSREMQLLTGRMPIIVGGEALDLEYLRRRAKAEGIEKELESLLAGREERPCNCVMATWPASRPRSAPRWPSRARCRAASAKSPAIRRRRR